MKKKHWMKEVFFSLFFLKMIEIGPSKRCFWTVSPGVTAQREHSFDTFLSTGRRTKTCTSHMEKVAAVLMRIWPTSSKVVVIMFITLQSLKCKDLTQILVGEQELLKNSSLLNGKAFEVSPHWARIHSGHKEGAVRSPTASHMYTHPQQMTQGVILGC